MSDTTKAPVPVPKAKNPDSITDLFKSFYELVAILRRECPWDRKQTNESIAHLLIEESYETIDAIHNGDDAEFSKELGDLLLHVVMHSIMAEQRGAFNFKDVINKIHEKLVFRHPHVFSGLVVDGEEEVIGNWEKLKKKEGRNSTLDGVPPTLPSLLRAERIQHKASRVGFDWDNSDGPWNKVEEELGEFRETIAENDIERSSEELGDLLFSIVNAARFAGLVAEESLQKTNKKFITRFQYIEKRAKEQGRTLEEMSLAEMDALWEEAKTAK